MTRSQLVREGGLEPPRPYEHWHLKPARLPFRHSRARQYDASNRVESLHLAYQHEMLQ